MPRIDNVAPEQDLLKDPFRKAILRVLRKHINLLRDMHDAPHVTVNDLLTDLKRFMRQAQDD